MLKRILHTRSGFTMKQSSNMHTVIFVHGFGVKKDARGMFTEIVDFLSSSKPDLRCVLVDLNIVDNTNDIRMNPLSTQAEILEKVYRKEVETGASIDVICHSQGCVVGSIANLPEVRKYIFLAPPTNNDIEKTIRAFSERPGTIINLEGESFFMRGDRSRTIVPKEYWDDREKIDYEKVYTDIQSKQSVTVIVAGRDEVVSNTYTREIFSQSNITTIDANHNFEGKSRRVLLETIASLL
jgi:hypothetical protein